MEELCADILHPGAVQIILSLLSIYRECCMDLMTTSVMMDEDQCHSNKRILDFTMEMIYLLKGEVRRILEGSITKTQT